MDDAATEKALRKGFASNVVIRTATVEDVCAIARLLNQLVPEIRFEDASSVCRQLLALKTTEVIVGELDREVIGVITLSFRPAMHHGGLLGVIDELVVEERYRNGGLGNRLVDRAIDVFRQRGAVDIEVITAIHRTRTHQFYERKGFSKRSYTFRYPLCSQARPEPLVPSEAHRS